MRRTFRDDAREAVCVPAVFLQTLGFISAVEEFALEELHSDDSKDEHEEDVDDEDVQNVLQRIYNTVEHRLEYSNTHKYTRRSVNQLSTYSQEYAFFFLHSA